MTGANNKITEEKQNYIKLMRIDLCDQDIISKSTGALNLKYFNVKKGQYWSKRETKHLEKCLILYGATKFHEIRHHVDLQWQKSDLYEPAKDTDEEGKPLG